MSEEVKMKRLETKDQPMLIGKRQAYKICDGQMVPVNRMGQPMRRPVLEMAPKSSKRLAFN